MTLTLIPPSTPDEATQQLAQLQGTTVALAVLRRVQLVKAAEAGVTQQQLALSLLDACRDLPHIIEITCANGLNVIAHADYPAAEYRWQKPVSAQRVLWNRDRLMGFMVGKGEGISGADHFWFGHTPLDRRYDFNNLHYIDTGAVFDGYFTLAQLQ